MQGADAGCTHLYGEPEASAQLELISPPYPALTRRISEHTEDENKGAVTYVHLSHSAALDARSGYPQRKWLVCKRLSNSPPTTDNPPGQNLEWSRAGQLDWASFFLFLFLFYIVSTKNVSWANSSGFVGFFVGFFFKIRYTVPPPVKGLLCVSVFRVRWARLDQLESSTVSLLSAEEKQPVSVALQRSLPAL